jgi:hypothetical protein
MIQMNAKLIENKNPLNTFICPNCGDVSVGYAVHLDWFTEKTHQPRGIILGGLTRDEALHFVMCVNESKINGGEYESKI